MFALLLAWISREEIWVLCASLVKCWHVTPWELNQPVYGIADGRDFWIKFMLDGSGSVNICSAQETSWAEQKLTLPDPSSIRLIQKSLPSGMPYADWFNCHLFSPRGSVSAEAKVVVSKQKTDSKGPPGLHHCHSQEKIQCWIIVV